MAPVDADEGGERRYTCSSDKQGATGRCRHDESRRAGQHGRPGMRPRLEEEVYNVAGLEHGRQRDESDDRWHCCVPGTHRDGDGDGEDGAHPGADETKGGGRPEQLAPTVRSAHQVANEDRFEAERREGGEQAN
jgi:hypothetical protein